MHDLSLIYSSTRLDLLGANKCPSPERKDGYEYLSSCIRKVHKTRLSFRSEQAQSMLKYGTMRRASVPKECTEHKGAQVGICTKGMQDDRIPTTKMHSGNQSVCISIRYQMIHEIRHTRRRCHHSSAVVVRQDFKVTRTR